MRRLPDPQTLYDQIRVGLGAFQRVAPDVIARPRAYPREAMLLALIVALLLLVAFLVLYAIGTGLASFVGRQRLGVHPYRRRNTRVALIVAVALLGAALAVVAAPKTVEGSRLCVECHPSPLESAAWSSGPHARVACYGCHAGSGAMGWASVGTREFAKYFGVHATGSATDTRRCVDCHRDGLSHGPIVRAGIRMSHAEVVSAGVSCFDCHPDAGHERPSMPTAESTSSVGQATALRSVGGRDGTMGPRVGRSMMSRCLGCHDGAAASTECDTCHLNGPLDIASSPATDAPVTGAVALPTLCTGCHSAATRRECTDCHGLEMPHPASFRRKHAGMSAQRPALCTRCHETASSREACACHAELSIHGTYSEWFPKHADEARQSGGTGCKCHEQSFCGDCHDDRVIPESATAAVP